MSIDKERMIRLLKKKRFKKMTNPKTEYEKFCASHYTETWRRKIKGKWLEFNYFSLGGRDYEWKMDYWSGKNSFSVRLPVTFSKRFLKAAFDLFKVHLEEHHE